MASDTSKRRFAPIPVETTVKSSKSKKEEETTASGHAAPRRFAVEPIEQSEKKGGNTPRTATPDTPPPTPKAARKFAVEPVEQSERRGGKVNETSSTASKPTRKFAVQPVETSTKTSKEQKEDSNSSSDASKKPRKFAIQPVETSSSSNRAKERGEAPKKSGRKFAIEPVETSTRTSKGTDSDKPKARFAPQPVETQVRHHSPRVPARRDSELDETPADLPKGVLINRPKRSFAPQLIDTSARSRRTSDEKSPVPHHYRTDVTPGHMVTATGEALFPGLQESKRAPLPHERRKERLGTSHGNVRSHSFLCPDLETIESSESAVSAPGRPQRSTSPSTNNDSPLPTSTNLDHPKPAMDGTTGQSDSFSKYMLGLEVKRAEQILQEQALAAFPNSDFHEPVEHYVDEDDDIIIDDRPATWEGHDDDDDEEDEAKQPQTFRQNTSKVDWDLVEMKKHQEALEQSREQARVAALKKKSEQGSSPWWKPAAVRDFGLQQPDSEMSQMLNRARPPMLGSDLKFPRSSSPEPARFDITQGSHVLRSQMCYLTEQADSKNNESKTAGLWGGSASPAKAPSGEKGLWAGLCSAGSALHSDDDDGAMPSGLVTPAVLEPANPFDETLPRRVTGAQLRPPTPPYSRRKLQQQGVVVPKIDQVLNTDQELDELMAREYPDSFITQVFNYLSLGYPSLARSFDEELSKITMITISELRQDDEVAKTMPKGYIRIGEDFVGREDGTNQELEDGGCVRWRALKKYIREWARQEKGMVRVQAAPWGAAARKGSWAW